MGALTALVLMLFPAVSQGGTEAARSGAGPADQQQQYSAGPGPRIRPALAVRKSGDSSLLATYTVTNLAAAPLRFLYSDGQQYEFVLNGEEGELWRWSADMAFSQAMWEQSLAPGEAIVAEEPVAWPSGRARLLLRAYLTLAPPQPGDGNGNATREETEIGIRLHHGTDDVGEGQEEAATAGRSDFDGSGVVDYDDFFAFADAFGTSRGDPGFESGFDLDGDGRVGFGDFFLFASIFGTILPSQ